MDNAIVMCGDNVVKNALVTVMTLEQATKLATRRSKKNPHAVYKVYKLDCVVTSEITTTVDHRKGV